MTNKCEDRIDAHLESRIEDLQKLYDLYWEDADKHDEDLGNLYEYGLSLDFVAPETFEGQNESYFRYQLSWGGPSDEFRIFADQATPHRWAIYRIEYRFMDWGDGARRVLDGEQYELIATLFEILFSEPEIFIEQALQNA